MKRVIRVLISRRETVHSKLREKLGLIISKPLRTLFNDKLQTASVEVEVDPKENR